MISLYFKGVAESCIYFRTSSSVIGTEKTGPSMMYLSVDSILTAPNTISGEIKTEFGIMFSWVNLYRVSRLVYQAVLL